MSDLQIALIAIGALIIVAVIIINWWQERRFHRQVESNFSPLKRDALLDDPALDADGFNDVLDNRATEHFSIDDKLSEISMQETGVAFENTDRFVKLPESFNSDNAEVSQVEVSIDAAYDQLINAKLDKVSTHNAEAKIDTKVTSPIDTSTHQNVIRTNHFKEIFDEVLNPVSTTNPKVEAESKVELTLHLPSMLHGQMDLTAVLYLATETSISTLSNVLTGLFGGYDKPVFVHVLDTNNQWHLLQDLMPSQEILISKIACSIQLADRGGAVSRSSLNRFQLAVETLGLDINAHVEWQGAGDVLTNANALDAFCIEVDKTIGFHLLHGESGAFTGTKLRGLAEAQGLKLSSEGIFKYFNQSASEQSSHQSQTQPSFVMFNRDDHPFSADMLRTSVVKGVTFQFDIPHVKQCAEAFNQMVQVARQMEVSLNAKLVDDNNKLLGDIQIEKIRQQLKVIHATMLVRGIVPGSDSAHRLFS